jgi:hypothetical protein
VLCWGFSPFPAWAVAESIGDGFHSS